jgi:putative flippase GtrA
VNIQILKEFLTYSTVGIVNTLLGFGIIFTLMYAGVSAISSNAIGYTIGAFVSYGLNSHYTFKTTKHSTQRMFIFFAVLGMAYILNLITLLLLLPLLNAYLAQILSAIVYTVSAFVLAKYIVFKEAQ